MIPTVLFLTFGGTTIDVPRALAGSSLSPAISVQGTSFPVSQKIDPGVYAHALWPITKVHLANLAEMLGRRPLHCTHTAVPLPVVIVVRPIVVDGSMAIEIRSQRWSFLLSVESDPEESGWAIVSLLDGIQEPEIGELADLERAADLIQMLASRGNTCRIQGMSLPTRSAETPTPTSVLPGAVGLKPTSDHSRNNFIEA